MASNSFPSPLQKLALGYFTLILLGWLVLSACAQKGGAAVTVDHFFTATSALTTTGLSTVNIADTYNFGGEFMILLLFQLGGVGYMSVAGSILLKGTYGVQDADDEDEEDMVMEDYNVPEGTDFRSFVRRIIRFTLAVELIGAITLGFIFTASGEEDAIWKGIFTSVSAFCTAGFTLSDNSLEGYRDNGALNLAISLLSLAGAFGFLFFGDVWDRIRGKCNRLSLTSRIILLVIPSSVALFTVVLLFVANGPGAETQQWTAMTALFHSASAITTSGFSTVAQNQLAAGSMMVTIVFMFIGASPSGTGGGVKNTTMATGLAYIMAVARRKEDVDLLGRNLANDRVHLAVAIIIAHLILLGGGTTLLLLFSPGDGFMSFYEATSALATVGLSTGISEDATHAGKVTLMVLMFMGRIGPISFLMMFTGRSANEEEEKSDDRESDEDVAIEG